ncbi:DUF3298 and DUF4163 domain-containing protein [Constantimarinum furrinae]|uniref:DUF3298 domain-containing protein n=1 Tax=Constantimarinum furrinae TaxID=2562285 RepID=A0A7G8PTF8_9FLAO|nr:DUF3298 and DUF4163 domain-containing protein [Constantimarinum furrinae]QNJ97624.1 hypothetical protein ALE3EI_1051 [Constantimarinum furrinae]
MNNRIVILLGLFLVFLGCDKERELEFTSESFSQKQLPECEQVSCPEITVSYTKILGDDEVAKNINLQIKGFIIGALYMGDDERPSTAKTIAEAASGFIRMYRMHSAEFPDMKTEYFADISVTEGYVSKTLISFEMRSYLFTGGAHGYGSVYFTNFDPQTGEEISSEALFNDKSAITLFVEKKFRKEFDIPETGNINTTGFWFENDTFYLPEHIGFTEQEMIVHYNQYDIASYAAGPVTLNIPLSQIEPFLQIKLK